MSTTAQFFGGASAEFTRRFYADGTFTVPTGVTSVFVRCVGGGGGGGGGTTNNYGGGGGGGGMGMKQVDVTPGANVTITIGGGGAGGAATPTVGGSGGTSSFGGFLSSTGGGGGGANSGSGGTSGLSGSATGADYEVDGTAGEAGSGTTHIKGGDSGDIEIGRWTVAVSTPVGTDAGSTIGAAGDNYTPFFSWGQGGFSASTFSGEAGKFPGGGGARTTTAGKNGASGYIEIRW